MIRFLKNYFLILLYLRINGAYIQIVKLQNLSSEYSKSKAPSITIYLSFKFLIVLSTNGGKNSRNNSVNCLNLFSSE